MATKKGYLLFTVTMLLSFSGCSRKMKKQEPKHRKTQVAYNNNLFKTVDIPLAHDEVALAEQDSVSSFFDEESQEFVAYDKHAQDESESLDVLNLAADEINQLQKNDYAWVDAEQEKEFKTVYFNFGKYNVRPDQKDIIKSDIVAARTILEEARSMGENPTIVIEGHACHAGGSRPYNMTLSQQRANAVSNFFISEGVPQENIKVVGRGQDVPVVAEGDKEEQAPNRRVEVKVIYS